MTAVASQKLQGEREVVLLNVNNDSRFEKVVEGDITRYFAKNPPLARSRTSTSPSRAVGTGNSIAANCSGPPKSARTTSKAASR